MRISVTRRHVVPALALCAVGLVASVSAVLATTDQGAPEAAGVGLAGAQGDGLSLVYRGAETSPDQLKRLNAEGRAMVGVHNRELSCQGIALYFDTATQADAYGREYEQREKERAATAASAATSDECSGYENAPRFLE